MRFRPPPWLRLRVPRGSVRLPFVEPDPQVAGLSVAVPATDIWLTFSAVVAMGRQKVEQMLEHHGGEDSRMFLFEPHDNALVGIMESHQSGFPGLAHLLGVLSRPSMIVKAHDFFNGLTDGLYHDLDSGHLIFRISPLAEFLEEPRWTMLAYVLTIRSGAPAVLRRSARHSREREGQADGNDSARLHRSPIMIRSWVAPVRCHPHNQYL